MVVVGWWWVVGGDDSGRGDHSRAEFGDLATAQPRRHTSACHLELPPAA